MRMSRVLLYFKLCRGRGNIKCFGKMDRQRLLIGAPMHSILYSHTRPITASSSQISPSPIRLRSHFKHLDGYNTHIYSWTNTPKGVVGTFPESKVSIFREILQVIRFRDANLPSLPIYVTEFGWDSFGAEEACLPPMTRCVSEWSQAVYLVRGLLMLSRLGMQRASLFFFANTDGVGGGKGGRQVRHRRR